MRRSIRHTRGYKEVVQGLRLLDQEVFDAVAHKDNPLLDKVLPPLTWAADYSKLWMVTAAGMMASGSPQLRRAAVRGLATLAVTSLVTNQGAKRLKRRERPGHTSVPFMRRIRHYPTSSSFPSGHSASAAAFAMGVGTEDKPVGIVLGGLAALVGLSRVYTGAHYPGDVLVGFAIGGTVAEVGKRLFPPALEPVVPLTEPLLVTTKPRPNGAGLVLVVNPASGSGTGEKVLEQVRAALPAAVIVELSKDDDVGQIMHDAAEKADVLGVAGGDGTVATAAKAALAADKPLAVFPAGTFNHFAKEICCPTPDHTIQALRDGTLEKVDVVRLNDETIIVNTASIGAYPQFVEIREKYERKVGKPLAAVYALAKVLKNERTVKIRYDGKVVETELFFLGNSLYTPPGFAPERRPQINDGLIDIRMLEVGKPWARARTLVALARGRLDHSPFYHELHVPAFSFTVLDGPTPVAYDGEVGPEMDRCEFVSLYRVLPVYCPPKS